MAAEPTFLEKSILFILMAEAQEIPNTLLTNHYQAMLVKPSREKLRDLGLIRVREETGRIYLELTDLGWKQCVAEFGAETPARVRAGGSGSALYAVLGAIKRYLDQADVSYHEFFLPTPKAPVASTPAEIEARIRTAYGDLAREPGGWVGLADLRDRLDGLDRGQVDAALVAMNHTKSVRVSPESNQKMLGQRDWDAAVTIGNQSRHMLAIDS